MVEAGSLQIAGSIQTTEIESGLGRIDKGFKSIDETSKSVNSDFIRMNQQASRLGKSLGVIAIAGVTAMVALAKGSPAVAGSMAKIQVTLGKLSRTLGEALAPAFEIASDAFAKFTGWVSENKDDISFFATTVLGGFVDALSGIQEGWQWLSSNVTDIFAKIGIDLDLGKTGNWLVEHYGPEAAAALLGFTVAGPVGAAVGAGVVYAGRRINDPQLYMDEWSQMGSLLGLGPIGYNPFKSVNMSAAVLGEDDRQ